MATSDLRNIRRLLGLMVKAHPWHGISIGPDAPGIVTSYIEIVPTDTVKYELDKETGNLKVDRPQRYSNVCPTLYGLIPQTYCGENVAELCRKASGRGGIHGDGDPMDICVLTENVITHGNIILRAIPIGGFRMIDGDEADDKIISVLAGDPLHGSWRDISDCPSSLVERLQHYFLTYKMAPGDSSNRCEIVQVYGIREAHEAILASRRDYTASYGDIEQILRATRDG